MVQNDTQEQESNNNNKSSYVGKKRAQAMKSQYDINNFPQEDIDRIMANLPEDDSRPVDAYELSQNDIRRELVDRGIQPKGFFNDDAARLQEEYNQEHLDAQEHRKQDIIQRAAQSYIEQRDQMKRLKEEEELKQEIQEIQSDSKLDLWIKLIQSNQTPEYTKLRLSLVGARSLSKQLAYNISLRTLDLSRNALTDESGKCLAKMLHTNTALNTLELGFNEFGPSSATDLGEALKQNSYLKSLNLEGNPLSKRDRDYSGVIELGNAMAENTGLTTLNLCHTRLGTDGGRAMSKGLEDNDTLICLQLGCDNISVADERKIMEKIRENQEIFFETQKKQNKIKLLQRQAALRERTLKEKERKQAENEAWLERRRLERKAQREREDEERQRKLKEEEERSREKAQLAEQARREKADQDKKKKGKKKGKK